jgi:hypothetical protein
MPQQVFFTMGPCRLDFCYTSRECTRLLLGLSQRVQHVLHISYSDCQVSIERLLQIKIAQVQLAKSGMNLLTYSDIDMSPQSLPDRVLHFLQGLLFIPRDSLYECAMLQNLTVQFARVVTSFAATGGA